MYYGESSIFSELREVFHEQIESFNEDIVVNSASVPVIYTDSTQRKVLYFGNIDSSKISDPEYVSETIAEMKENNPPIKLTWEIMSSTTFSYNHSPLLVKLKMVSIYSIDGNCFFLDNRLLFI